MFKAGLIHSATGIHKVVKKPLYHSTSTEILLSSDNIRDLEYFSKFGDDGGLHSQQTRYLFFPDETEEQDSNTDYNLTVILLKFVTTMTWTW